MALYQIPLRERFAFMGNDFKSLKVKCLMAGKAGVFVYYNDGQGVISHIPRDLIQVEETQCFIEANSVEEAIKRFYAELDGARTGGEFPQSKAVWIDPGRLIIELPYCGLLRKSPNGRFVCDKIATDRDEESEMCVVEDSRDIEDCPIDFFWKRFFEKKMNGEASVEIVKEFGFKLVRATTRS